MLPLVLSRPGIAHPGAGRVPFEFFFIMASACVFLFIGLYLAPNAAIFRRYLRERPGWLADKVGAKNLWPVTLQDASTYHVNKLVPEDMGLLMLDPASHRIVIEGVLYRYLIYSEDVTKIKQVKSTLTHATVEIRFWTGREELRINVSSALLQDQLRYGFGDSPLWPPISQTLIPASNHDESTDESV